MSDPGTSAPAVTMQQASRWIQRGAALVKLGDDEGREVFVERIF